MKMYILFVRNVQLNLYGLFLIFEVIQGGYEEPVSVWPLFNRTQGYDVIKDENTAILGGTSVYAHLLVDGYDLDGTTYVDIPLHIGVDQDFALVVLFKFNSVDSGVLFSYKDDENMIHSEMSAGRLNLRLNRNWADCEDGEDRKLTATGEETVSMTFEHDKKIRVIKAKQTVCELKVSGQLSNAQGVIRMGGSFSGDVQKAVDGTISCVRLYATREIDDKTMKDCSQMPPDTLPDKEGKALEKSSKWEYTGPYPCMSFPCRNGGSCTGVNQTAYRCECVPGYTGNNCEEDIDECTSDPCQNEGRCSNVINAFICDCTPFFTGPHCETSLRRTGDGNIFNMKVGVRPNSNDSFLRQKIVSNDVACGLFCQKDSRCLSFAVETLYVTSDNRCHCTTYHSTRAELKNSHLTRYYIMDPN